MKFNEKSRRQWQWIDSTRAAVNASEEDFACLLGLSELEFSTLRKGGHGLSACSWFKFCRAFEIEPAAILDLSFQFDRVIQRLKSDWMLLPNRYLEGAFSTRRTSLNVLSYLDHHYPSIDITLVLGSLSLGWRHFALLSEKINIKCLRDICELLKDIGFTQEEFSKMGIYSAIVNKNSSFGLSLAHARSITEAYELAFSGLLRILEQNYDYELLQVSKERVRFRAKQRESVCDALKEKIYSSHSVCGVRAGVGASFPVYLGCAPGIGSEVRCIHHGDASCEYEIDLSPALASHGTRTRLL